MKKKIILIGSGILGILLLVGISFYLYKNLVSSKDLSSYIPKNAKFVMKLNVAQIGEKIDLKEISELKFFKKEIMRNLKSSEKDFLDKVMGDPKNSGLQLRTAPTFFLFEHKEDPMAALMCGVSDAKKFKVFLTEMSDNISIKDPAEDKYYTATYDKEDNMAIYFNNDIVLMLIDIEKQEIPLKKVREEIMKTEEENSILSNQGFNKVNEEKNDLMAFLNVREIASSLKDNNASLFGIKVDADAIESLPPLAMTLNFNDNDISFKTFYTESVDAQGLKEGGFTDNELKNITPGGSPLAFMTVNLDFEKILENIKSFGLLKNLNRNDNSEYDEYGYEKPENSWIDDPDLKKLLTLFSGKMSIALSGVVNQTKYDEYDMSETIKSQPGIYFWAKIDDKSGVEEYLSRLVEKEEGIYSINEYDFYKPTIYLTLIENDLFISTDLSGLLAKKRGDDWDKLKEGNGRNMVSSKSMAAYFDLNYNNYSDLIEAFMKEDEIEKLDKINKKVFSLFKDATMNSSNSSAELKIQLREGEKNSLQRLLLMIDDAYKIGNTY